MSEESEEGEINTDNKRSQGEKKEGREGSREGR